MNWMLWVSAVIAAFVLGHSLGYNEGRWNALRAGQLLVRWIIRDVVHFDDAHLRDYRLAALDAADDFLQL